METETIGKLFLELSQVTKATTPKELKLRKAVSLLNSMVESGERHSDTSRQIVREVLDA